MVHRTELDWRDDVTSRLTDLDAAALGAQLQQTGVVKLDDFLPSAVHDVLAEEVDQLLVAHGKRVNALIPSTGNTPRKYVSVHRDRVFEHAPTIAGLYDDAALLRFLAALTQGDVITCPYEPEQIVVNGMSDEGDTHGWHWDDYSYSLVYVLEAPDRDSGAQVQYVDGTSWSKESAQVQHVLDTKQVLSLDLEPGSAYVLLGKRVMHRVSPLLRADARKIICFSYATEEERYAEFDHGSMEDIYG
jgi:alkylated DNA repair dioxygenase AlkB